MKCTESETDVHGIEREREKDKREIQRLSFFPAFLFLFLCVCVCVARSLSRMALAPPAPVTTTHRLLSPPRRRQRDGPPPRVVAGGSAAALRARGQRHRAAGREHLPRGRTTHCELSHHRRRLLVSLGEAGLWHAAGALIASDCI